MRAPKAVLPVTEVRWCAACGDFTARADDRCCPKCGHDRRGFDPVRAPTGAEPLEKRRR